MIGSSNFRSHAMRSGDSLSDTVQSGGHLKKENPYNDPSPLAACRTGNLEWLKEELTNNSSIARQPFGSGKTGEIITLLHMASQEGHVGVVSLLLDKGADPESRRHDGTTALIMASYHGHAEVASLLLDKGADPESRQHDGTTALFMASCHGHAEVAGLLLGKGADPESRQHDGTTALFMASQNGHAEVVSLLLNAGAEPRKKWKMGWFVTKSPIEAAKQNNHKGVVKVLRKSLSERKKRSEPVTKRSEPVTEKTPLLEDHC